MALAINKDVFITCAVTGSGSSQDKSSEVPRSPKEIADSAIDAAKAESMPPERPNITLLNEFSF